MAAEGRRVTAGHTARFTAAALITNLFELFTASF